MLLYGSAEATVVAVHNTLSLLTDYNNILLAALYFPGTLSKYIAIVFGLNDVIVTRFLNVRPP